VTAARAPRGAATGSTGRGAPAGAPIFVGDTAAFAALAARGRLQRTVERLREALEYAERPDRFLYGSDWPLAPMAAYRAFLAPLLDDPAWRAVRTDNARALFRL
jgi:predicted TIM-barrel fold metal-dependent hydrolase